jgi:pyruvate formate lyase activating enzyme
MIEYFKKLKNNKIECNLCHHHCKLGEGSIGICRVNQNSNQELKNLVYNRPIAIHLDPVEKKPLYHFLPFSSSLSLGTNGCNFKCPFCQNHTISQSSKVANEIFTKEDIVSLALQNGAKSISYTYTEPTIFYPYARDIALLAKENNLKNIFVSNGYFSSDLINDMEGIVDACNIDLKSFNKDYYKKEIKAHLDVILENLIYLKTKNIWLEITTLIIDGINSEESELREIARFIKLNLGADTPWHISAFFPTYKMLNYPPTNIKSLELAYNIAKEEGLNYVYIGNSHKKYNTNCPSCNEIVIDRDKNSINLNSGKCPKCNTEIAGVFNE